MGIAVGAGIAVAGVGLAAYFLTRHLTSAGLQFLADGTTAVQTTPNGSYSATVSGGTPNGPAELLFSLTNDPTTAGLCGGAVGAAGCPSSFDSNGNINATYTLTNAPPKFYAWIYDPTAKGYSNAVVFTTSSPTTCTPNQVSCYAGGTLVACCPPGELCVDASTGACPGGSAPDPANSGCCVKQGGASYAAYWIAENGGNLAWQVSVCQPTTLYPPGCCGTPVISGTGLSFRLQVLDQNHLPIAGVNVLWLVPALANMPFQLDAQSYVTDANGFIYPTVSWPDPPTECFGNSHSEFGQVQFYVQGEGPGTGAAVAAINFSATAVYQENIGFAGTCGSC